MKDFMRKPIFTALCISISNIIIVLVTGIWNCTDGFFETFAPGILFTILSVLYILGVMAACILLRKFKKKNVLKGMFIYEMIGVFCFVIYLIILMLGNNGLLDIGISNFILQIPHYIFCWWVVFIEPLSTTVARLLGTWNMLITAIMWLILVYFTGSSILGIKKDKEFEQKIKDRHLSDRR